MRCNIIMLHLHSLATVNKGNIGWYCVWREISSIDMKTGYLLTLLYNDSCLTFIHVKSITSPGMKIGFISFFTLARIWYLGHCHTQRDCAYSHSVVHTHSEADHTHTRRITLRVSANRISGPYSHWSAAAGMHAACLASLRTFYRCFGWNLL